MNKYVIPLILAIAFLIVGLFTLSDYGMNWDEPFRMMRGKLYLRFYLNNWVGEQSRISPILIAPNEYISRFDILDGEGENLAKLPQRPLRFKEFKEFEKKSNIKTSFYYHEKFAKIFFLGYFAPGHPPLFDILAAITNTIIYKYLSLLPDLEAYHVLYILISSVGVFITALFAYEVTKSKFAGLVAGVSMALFPLFFAEAHFNMKDPLQASMFSGAVLAFWHWFKYGKSRYFVIFSIFFALAMTIKWNIIFLPFVIIPWLFVNRNTNEFKRFFKLKKLILCTLFLASFVFLIITISSPNGWNNPVGNFIQRINFYSEIGTRANPVQPAGFIFLGINFFPLVLLFIQTPEVILVLALIAAFWIVKKRGGELKVGYLILFWLLVPILRISLPHVWFYNGFRQIMEVLPALSVLAGVGSTYIVTYLKKKKFSNKIPIMYIQLVILICTTIFLIIPIFKFHPNENLYFNSFVGGLSGAKRLGLVDKKISYGNIYRQAAEWLNENAPKNANVAHLDGTTFSLSPLFIRPDISVSPFHFSGFDRKGEYILMLYDPNMPTLFASRYVNNFLKPIHYIKVDNNNMLTIYKNDSKNLIIKDTNMRSLNNFKIYRNASGMQIDLGKTVNVTKLKLVGVVKNCSQPYSQYIDEFVEFYNPSTNSSIKYGLQEHRVVSKTEVDFLYAGELARYIKINFQSQYSCFYTTRISEISYLP